MDEIFKLKEMIENDRKFFNNSKFFEPKVKQKIQNKSNIDFQELTEWCRKQCCLKPKEIKYIGDETYVEFFLFSIFRHKDILEKLWKKVYEFVDKSFRKRLIDNRLQFKQYLWELYLIYYFILINKHVIKRKNNSGPDILIEDGEEKIFIECIAPTVGENENRVPEMKFDIVDVVPISEIKKRFEFALKNKVNKIKKYIEEGIIQKEDKVYIAINTSCLSYYGELMDLKEPLLLETCRELKFFENNKFISGILYNHKSIFEYDDNFCLITINDDYTVKKNDIEI